MKKLIVVALAIVALAFITTQITAAGPSKCSSSKMKVTGKKASGRAKCYAKAVAKGQTVSSDCLSKASTNFGSGFAKAEAKGGCLAPNGDTNAIESKVDTFVDTVRNIVNSSAPGPSVCDSKKIAASGKKASNKSKCYAKAIAKGLAVDGNCLSKAELKFSAAVSRAESAGGCTHVGQTNSLESAVNAFINDVNAELAPAASTTTTTSAASTTTTLGPRLSFTTTVGTTSCGGAGLATPPAAPVSGEIDSDTAGTTKISDLGTGCLYFGGGNATIVAGGAIPDGATSILGITGGNTLVASSGTGLKTCTKAAGPGKHCINNNSMPMCTNDGNCGGSTGACALDANCFFGPPLPIVSPAPFGSLTTCVLNAIQTDASGTVTLNTGDASVNLNLSSRVYITGNTASPCPKCLSNVCDTTWKTNTLTTSPDSGKACTPTGSQLTTTDCRPSLPGFQAPLPINIMPLTTGHTIVTSSTGLFCPSQTNAGAFGQASTRAIQQTGSPGGDLTDGNPHSSVLGYSFCIPATGSAAVDGVADLPGPGSLGLKGNSQFIASPSGAFLDASPLP